jgi:hypothetical protein
MASKHTPVKVMTVPAEALRQREDRKGAERVKQFKARVPRMISPPRGSLFSLARLN